MRSGFQLFDVVEQVEHQPDRCVVQSEPGPQALDAAYCHQCRRFEPEIATGILPAGNEAECDQSAHHFRMQPAARCEHVELHTGPPRQDIT
ncbi:hypothetical protein A5642_27965 [Mycolicibacterium mucogenicum]|uniref:Uncharacterized protein n=1 Tax=Mycolicibacterium mucogenicum TaxID=56689 RepID=A0A1A0M9D1_MYCMU|nr:hypothetical protein A5642_27965 [Mycolicibacterium mucogenicum]